MPISYWSNFTNKIDCQWHLLFFSDRNYLTETPNLAPFLENSVGKSRKPVYVSLFHVLSVKNAQSIIKKIRGLCLNLSVIMSMWVLSFFKRIISSFLGNWLTSRCSQEGTISPFTSLLNTFQIHIKASFRSFCCCKLDFRHSLESNRVLRR